MQTGRAMARCVACAIGLAGAVAACRLSTHPHGIGDRAKTDPAPPAPPTPPASTRGEPVAAVGDAVPAPPDAGTTDAPPDDPMRIHRETREELLSLFQLRDMTDDEKKRLAPDAFLHTIFGVDGPGRVSQGNKALARHTISHEACLKGLEGVVIQTAEQRALCGAENMVPIWAKGQKPAFCIDVFEFPNKACELPMVWIPPAWAKHVCELQGKRLCAQGEWNQACRGDPDGGPDTRYAYGDRLDLEVCHTNLPHRTACRVSDAKTAWQTCSTDTEPAGSFPRCRSRFGVFDQHGNAAEIMTRKEADGAVVSQLKGSAWYYVELAKEPDEPPRPGTRQGAHPDHCNFDPRWHVEPLETAQHVNYHLGFRCCKTLPP